MFGTNLKYPSPYREALFVLDWSYGRVLAVHLAPRGAGYRAALELFLGDAKLYIRFRSAGLPCLRQPIRSAAITRRQAAITTSSPSSLAASSPPDAVPTLAVLVSARRRLPSLSGRDSDSINHA